MSESNVERLERIKKEWQSVEIGFARRSGKTLTLFKKIDDMDFLIKQAERTQKLKDENYQMRIKYENTGTMMDRAALRSENQRLREALAFYAESKNYEANVVDQWEPVVPVDKDAGNIARKALEGTE